ncbi:MAG: outer membrane lipoprotein carrier protein LolA [Holophagales bacterium]|jgi:outer membrane lipoprotein-sorting protein|nr:outer membrane lipoprotein carrier protein LolA [Holophagales bacterium]
MLPVLIAPPALSAPGQTMPPWWNFWTQKASFSSPFVQESESAAFGKLTKEGTILLAKGGRLRVEYEKGILLLSDGQQIVQYDPSTRTAQKFDLKNVSEEWPLLRLLTDPSALSQVFHINLQSDGKISLSPKKAGPPELLLEGSGAFLRSITWKDGTGAKQIMTLTAPKTPPDPGSKPFSFKLPANAKWIASQAT